ncbi:MAG: hypothetical protein Ta2E_11560 [Mycoplasmoidaceae bacterium]|nr:MAG: hypothetical protein Ta2E_11560 [Mycoplasmoidaceae bacterium]
MDIKRLEAKADKKMKCWSKQSRFLEKGKLLQYIQIIILVTLVLCYMLVRLDLKKHVKF